MEYNIKIAGIMLKVTGLKMQRADEYMPQVYRVRFILNIKVCKCTVKAKRKGVEDSECFEDYWG